VYGYADAAAHRDAVDQRHVRDFVLADRAVHRVLVPEEVGPQIERRGAHPLLDDRLNVASRAERLAAGALDDHHSHLRFVFLQFWSDLGHHRQVEGVQRFRPVQRDDAHVIFDFEQHVVHAGGR